MKPIFSKALPLSRLTSALLLTLALVACASSGPLGYGPANSNGRFGYTDSQLETGRYRITYNGSASDSADIVEGFAIRRAAELTIENGFDYFYVVSRDVSGEDRGGVALGGGVGSSRFGRRSSVGVGVGGNFGTVGSKAFYTVRIEVLMGKNPKPENAPGIDNGRLYDARSIMDSVFLNSPVPAQ